MALQLVFSACSKPVEPPSPNLQEVDPMVAESIRSSTAAVTGNPDSIGAWDNLGRTFFANGFPDMAILAFDQSIELNPFRPLPLYLRGLCKMDIYDMPGASVDLDAAIALSPDQPHLHWRAAWVAMESGNLPRAVVLADAALALAPDDYNSIRVRSRVHLATGETESGIQLLEPLLKKRPGDKHVLWLFARLLRAAGRVEEAKVYADAAGASVPVYSDPWAQWALQRKTGRTKEIRSAMELVSGGKIDVAQSRISRLKNYYPDDRDITLIEGIILSKQGRRLEALGVFETLAELHPNWASPRHRTALALIGDKTNLSSLSSETLSRIRVLLEVVVELDPNMTNARGQLTQLLARNKEWEAVREHLETCIQQQPMAVLHRVNLAAALFQLQKADEALEVLDETSLLFKRETVQSLAIRSDALISLGRMEDARATLHQLQNQSPGHPAIRRLEAALGDPQP